MAAWAAAAVAVPASTAAAASRAAWAAASAASSGRVGDGRGGSVAGRGCGVGSLGGSRGSGFGSGGRVGGVLRLGRLGGQGRGRHAAAAAACDGRGGGLACGVGRLGCRGIGRFSGDRGGGLGFGGARIPGGDGRGSGLFRGRGGPFGSHGPGVGLVVVAAADQGEAGCSNPSLRAGSQHGATRDLPLSQAGPMVSVAHGTCPLSGPRLSRCGTARCVSAPSMDNRLYGLHPPPIVMSPKKEFDGSYPGNVSDSGVCGNRLCHSWGSGVRSRGGTSPVRSPLFSGSAGEGARG